MRLFLAILLVSAPQGSGIWLDVPYTKQLENGCGSAVAWMVTEYWSARGASPGAHPTLEEIHQRLYSVEAGGVGTSDLQEFFTELGYNTFGFTATWADVEEHLALGRPLIAVLEPDGIKAPLHYVTIVGIDIQHSLVLLNDPATRKLTKMDRSDFERQWGEAENWMLLAVPR